MEQKFIVTIESDEKITSKEVADALNHCMGLFSLNENHDCIIIAKAREVKKNLYR